MALNKIIVKKVKEKSEKNPDIGNFLIILLEFESELPGWWKTTYNKTLENMCKEES